MNPLIRYTEITTDSTFKLKLVFDENLNRWVLTYSNNGYETTERYYNFRSGYYNFLRIIEKRLTRIESESQKK